MKNSYSGYENKLIESLENYKMLSGETSKNKTKYILNEISYLLNNAYYNEHTTEHIMPIKKERNWNHIDLSKEEYKKIINKLGNLTLITSEDNSAIKDESFEVKSSVYRNYQNKLTSSIVQEIDISIGSTNIRNILTECQCPEPVDDWTPINIQNRTKWMAELARYIWF